MKSGGLAQTKQNKNGRMQQQWWSPSYSQPSQATNESVESLDVGSRYKIKILKEALAKGPKH